MVKTKCIPVNHKQSMVSPNSESIQLKANINEIPFIFIIRDSIVVSIPACHAGDRGSIPRHGDVFYYSSIIWHILC